MIDILIPVLGRPWNVEPLVESIVSGTDGPYQIVFICSPQDSEQIEACRKTGQTTLTVSWQPKKADYARKINWGFSQTNSEWFFQGADDIRFGKHWDTYALNVAKGQRSVIGTNDLHHPGSRQGTHSTHLLIKRSYIEEQGGTFDQTGAVFSEAYDHQWIDNEFILTARRRGVWAFSKRSLVEHFHPIWKNADWDDTYRKSFRHAGSDRRLFLHRKRKLERLEGKVPVR